MLNVLSRNFPISGAWKLYIKVINKYDDGWRLKLPLLDKMSVVFLYWPDCVEA